VVAPNPDGLPELRLMTADASSPAVSPGMVWTTLIGFTLLYGALLVVELFLLKRYVQAGPEAVMPHAPPPGPDDGDDDEGGDDPGDRPADRRPTRDAEADVLAFAY
jgi:cytochrome d ubiquinol oxidase subunit I